MDPMLLPRIFAVALVAALSAFAQPPSPGVPIIGAAHIHLNSADPNAAIAFWTDTIGMSSSSAGSFSSVSTLGVKILFTRKTPSGPSAGSAIDHIALKVPDLQPVVERLSKTPYKPLHPQTSADRLMINGPDGVRIELIEDNSMYTLLEFNHIHLSSKQPKEMQAWYIRNLGARPGFVDTADSIVLPGANLAISQVDSALPTADRAIDHISFEVKDLENFCRQLVENGVKLDSTPHAVPELSASVALVSDPWGTRIELMEKSAH
jgi:catechol 2,3-dioxygenase-like lactoylglutathione lyase family enzyme